MPDLIETLNYNSIFLHQQRRNIFVSYTKNYARFRRHSNIFETLTSFAKKPSQNFFLCRLTLIKLGIHYSQFLISENLT